MRDILIGVFVVFIIAVAAFVIGKLISALKKWRRGMNPKTDVLDIISILVLLAWMLAIVFTPPLRRLIEIMVSGVLDGSFGIFGVIPAMMSLAVIFGGPPLLAMEIVEKQKMKLGIKNALMKNCPENHPHEFESLLNVR